MKLFLFAILSVLSACTDAEMAQRAAIGRKGAIQCYSGILKIYDGHASGKILSEKGSDGWYFAEDGTHDLIRVSGSCLIRN